MEKFTGIAVVMLISILGCHKADNVVDNGTELSGAVSSITGQITMWSNGGNRNIVLLCEDSLPSIFTTCSYSKIDSYGHFSLVDLKLPSPLSPSHSIYQLYVSPGVGFYTSKIAYECSDTTARILWGQFKVTTDSSSESLGVVERKSDNIFLNDTDYNFFRVVYLYATKDVVIGGSVADTIYLESINREYRRTRHYDLRLKKGWNMQVIYNAVSNSRTDLSGKITTYWDDSYTNYEPFPGKWFYTGI